MGAVRVVERFYVRQQPLVVHLLLVDAAVAADAHTVVKRHADEAGQERVSAVAHLALVYEPPLCCTTHTPTHARAQSMATNLIPAA